MKNINPIMFSKTCLNCQSELSNDTNYCPNCGARQLKGTLSTKEVFTELFDVILIWNKDFFLTFFHILISPQKVIIYYIKGGRNRYLNPLLYLLFCYFLYLLIASLLNKDLFFMSAMKGGVTGWNSVDETESLNLDSIIALNRYSKILYFLMLPIIAFLSSIFFRSSKLTFAEHLIINAYLLGQITLLGIIGFFLSYLPDKSIGLFVLFSISSIYMFFCQFQIFNNKALKSFLKSLGYIVFSIILISILYMLIAFFIAYLIK
ncbi:MAG: DUF3667 domain-containing protein [Bacteroidetes bacterium]|nr:DUF3667 domain-containing protein [Bacteroidota bacterium]